MQSLPIRDSTFSLVPSHEIETSYFVITVKRKNGPIYTALFYWTGSCLYIYGMNSENSPKLNDPCARMTLEIILVDIVVEIIWIYVLNS